MGDRIKKTCEKGHVFYKSTDCPVCPKCEATLTQQQSNQLPRIGAPATRALNRIGVADLLQLADHSENELLALHGFGPKALKIIKDELALRGISLRSV